MLLVKNREAESSKKIQNTLDNTLNEQFGFNLSYIVQNFTFFTELSATIPNIVGACASSARVYFGGKWVGCIVQKLNTALKNVIESEKGDATRVICDVEKVKETVRIFKAGGWNNALAQVLAL